MFDLGGGIFFIHSLLYANSLEQNNTLATIEAGILYKNHSQQIILHGSFPSVQIYTNILYSTSVYMILEIQTHTGINIFENSSTTTASELVAKEGQMDQGLD